MGLHVIDILVPQIALQRRSFPQEPIGMMQEKIPHLHPSSPSRLPANAPRSSLPEPSAMPATTIATEMDGEIEEESDGTLKMFLLPPSALLATINNDRTICGEKICLRPPKTSYVNSAAVQVPIFLHPLPPAL